MHNYVEHVKKNVLNKQLYFLQISSSKLENFSDVAFRNIFEHLSSKCLIDFKLVNNITSHHILIQQLYLKVISYLKVIFQNSSIHPNVYAYMHKYRTYHTHWHMMEDDTFQAEH